MLPPGYGRTRTRTDERTTQKHKASGLYLLKVLELLGLVNGYGVGLG